MANPGDVDELKLLERAQSKGLTAERISRTLWRVSSGSEKGYWAVTMTDNQLRCLCPGRTFHTTCTHELLVLYTGMLQPVPPARQTERMIKATNWLTNPLDRGKQGD